MIKISSQDIRQISELYVDGYSSHKISKLFNCSAEYIRKILKDNNIALRKYYQINHKHIIRERFFDVIDNQNKAYFLGLLFADGSVHSKYNSITLKLKIEDQELVSTLSKLISDKDISYRDLKNITLKVSSFHMKQSLMHLGCVPNKTFVLKFPDIDPKQYSHFIRGYFDGDGCINRYRDDFYISIVSTDEVCNAINNIIKDTLGICGKILKDKKMLERGNYITSILRYTGNRQVKVVLDWIYNDAEIYMQRKYVKYLELKARVEEVDSHRLNLKNI